METTKISDASKLRKLQLLTLPVFGVIWLCVFAVKHWLPAGPPDEFTFLANIMGTAALYGIPLFGVVLIALFEIVIRLPPKE